MSFKQISNTCIANIEEVLPANGPRMLLKKFIFLSSGDTIKTHFTDVQLDTLWLQCIGGWNVSVMHYLLVLGWHVGNGSTECYIQDPVDHHDDVRVCQGFYTYCPY